MLGVRRLTPIERLRNKGIDTEGIAASYAHGVLTVTIPVSPKAKPRKIDIATDAPSTITVDESHSEIQEAGASA